jgi:hypothetical protein
MNNYSLQHELVTQLRSRVNESAECALGPSGNGLAEVFADLTHVDTIKCIEQLATTDEGRAALYQIGRVAIRAYLGDLILDIDQGLTQIRFAVAASYESTLVPTDGLADVWNLTI